MIFNKNLSPQAISIPFNWIADYHDGTYLSEFDFTTNEANDFYSINQDETSRFGIIGQNNKFYFENSDGTFYLNGKRIDVAYEIDGKTHLLTNNFNKKDFITFKEAYADFNNESGIQKSHIQSINFGYKTLYTSEDFTLNFQTIVSVPLDSSPVYMEIKLTSETNQNGELILIKNGKEIERFNAPLSSGISGQLNWTVK